MPDKLADLSDLMESYRHRAQTIPFRPLSAAYADAANELETIIGGLRDAALQLPFGAHDRRLTA